MASPTGAIFTPLPATPRPAVVGQLNTQPAPPTMGPGGTQLPMGQAVPPQGPPGNGVFQAANGPNHAPINPEPTRATAPPPAGAMASTSRAY
jgi:hypothetical protein